MTSKLLKAKGLSAKNRKMVHYVGGKYGPSPSCPLKWGIQPLNCLILLLKRDGFI